MKENQIVQIMYVIVSWKSSTELMFVCYRDYS
jgi:hypothetical protein